MAHYDTVDISPGANDNASGVAGLLELARILASIQFAQTVQSVAVNLEERQREGSLDETGLFGSRALASHTDSERWEIEGVTVLEAIAYAGEQVAQKTPEGLPMALPEW